MVAAEAQRLEAYSESVARFRELLVTQGEEQVRLLVAGTRKDESPSFRRLCLDYLLEQATEQSFQMASSVLEDSDPVIVCRALAYFSERRAAVDSLVLVRLASRKDEEVKRAVWKYLGAVRDEEAASALEMPADMPVPLRCEVLKAIAQQRYEALFSVVDNALKSHDPAVRCMALRSSTAIGALKHLPEVLQLALHPHDLGTYFNAKDALAAYGDRAVELLAARFREGDEGERFRMLRLAAHIGTHQAAHFLTAAIQRPGSEAERELAIELVGALRARTAAPALLELMRELQVAGKTLFTVTRALASIGDDSAVDAAIACLRDAEAYHCGWHAVAALAELLGALGDQRTAPELERSLHKLNRGAFADDSPAYPNWGKAFAVQHVEDALSSIRKRIGGDREAGPGPTP